MAFLFLALLASLFSSSLCRRNRGHQRCRGEARWPLVTVLALQSMLCCWPHSIGLAIPAAAFHVGPFEHGEGIQLKRADSGFQLRCARRCASHEAVSIDGARRPSRGKSSHAAPSAAYGLCLLLHRHHVAAISQRLPHVPSCLKRPSTPCSAQRTHLERVALLERLFRLSKPLPLVVRNAGPCRAQVWCCRQID